MSRIFALGRPWMGLLPLLFPGPVTAQGLPWSTLLGGDTRDNAVAVAVDDRGLVTVAGVTESTSWPYAPRTGTGLAAFVMRLDPALSGAAQSVWCTMLDGFGDDMAFDLTMTADGKTVTVVGLTTSAVLPVTPGAYQAALRGTVDGFVMQLDGAAGAITYGSYLGGDGIDWIHGADRDAAGRLVLAGSTRSPSFPTTAGAFDTTFNGLQDTFVMVFDPTAAGAAQLVASTLLGGSGTENLAFALFRGPDLGLADVAVAGDGSIVVTGSTGSANFPVTPGAFQTVPGGGDDLYVSRLDGMCGTLRYSTFLGGTAHETGVKLALRGSLDVFVAGWTSSPGATFPTTAGAPQRTLGGRNDAVLAWLGTAGQGQADLRYATLLGGPDMDAFHDLAVEDSGVVTAVGMTHGGLIATPGAFEAVSSPEDALIVRLDPRGNGQADLHYLSLLSALPASWGERPFAMAQHGDGLLTITGFANTQQFPTTPGALQPNNHGLIDAFVLTFDLLPEHALRIGASTPACRGPIWLQVSSDPAPGNATFAVLGNGAPPGASGVGVVGPVLPTGVPVFNATLLVTPVVAVPTAADAQGAWRLPLPLPATLVVPSRLGLQWLWLTAPHCGGSGPLGASHGLGL